MSGPGGQEGSLWFTTDVETGLFELMARAEAEVLPEGRVVRIDSRDGDQSSTITLASIEPGRSPGCTASGFLDSGLTVFASTPPRPARGGRVAPGPGFGSRTSPASSARCTSA